MSQVLTLSDDTYQQFTTFAERHHRTRSAGAQRPGRGLGAPSTHDKQMPGSPVEAERHAGPTGYQARRDTQPTAAQTGIPHTGATTAAGYRAASGGWLPRTRRGQPGAYSGRPPPAASRGAALTARRRGSTASAPVDNLARATNGAVRSSAAERRRHESRARNERRASHVGAGTPA